MSSIEKNKVTFIDDDPEITKLFVHIHLLLVETDLAIFRIS